MSVNMDGMDLSYADHEVQTVGANLAIESTTTDGNVENNYDFEPVGPQDLDNDELAELVFVHVDVNLSLSSIGESTQTTPGVAQAEFGLGINQQRDEHPIQGFNNAPTAETLTNIDEDNAGGAFRAKEYTITDPGVIYNTELRAYAGFNDTANGSGGGANAKDSKTFTIDYRETFGSGPYVDSTDDINVFLEVGKDAVQYFTGAACTVTMVWAVEELPEGRASFARP